VFNRSDKPVAFPNGGFHKAGLLGVIIQRRTDFANRIIDSVLRVEEEILAPDFLDDFFTFDKLTLLFGQQDQQLHWLAFQTKPMAGSTQHEPISIQLAIPETQLCGGHGSFLRGLG